MGTDIYLSWDDMDEEEKERRHTGFSIGHGSFGYLRASIFMMEENAVLREVFPEECWEGGEHSYDFEGKFNILPFLIKKYLSAKIFGFKIEPSEGQREQITLGEKIISTFGGLGFETVLIPTNEDVEGAVEWANSLFKFFRLGTEKQKEGKDPKIYISW
jgi:hypothetical protein